MDARGEIAIRWTIGDVSEEGFEALRLSVWGAFKVFGTRPQYAICVNSLPLEEARRRVGFVPVPIEWLASPAELPPCLQAHVDPGMAEGVAWKLTPLRLFPERFELSLDNDCILWEMPAAIEAWLRDARGARCVIAEDVRRCLGQFDDLCGPGAFRRGIRGLPPGFDLDEAFRRVLAERPTVLVSELDEQGLQVAALSRDASPLVVTTSEVAISSPFPPHRPEPGSCGIHCVGLNAKHLSWELDGRAAVEHIRDHWQRVRPEIYERVGIRPPVCA